MTFERSRRAADMGLWQVYQPMALALPGNEYPSPNRSQKPDFDFSITRRQYSFIMPGCKKVESPGAFEIANPGPISAV